MIELESLDTLRNRRMNIQLFWLELLSFINIILIYFWHFPLRQSIKSTNMPTVRIFWQTLWCLMSLVWYYFFIYWLLIYFSGLPPIKVTQKKQYMTRTDGNEVEPIRGRLSSHWDNNTHFQERQKCLQLFIGDFGYNALYESQVRLDPLLFKDDVARFRKRYPNIDSVEPWMFEHRKLEYFHFYKCPFLFVSSAFFLISAQILSGPNLK